MAEKIVNITAEYVRGSSIVAKDDASQDATITFYTDEYSYDMNLEDDAKRSLPVNVSLVPKLAVTLTLEQCESLARNIYQIIEMKKSNATK